LHPPHGLIKWAPVKVSSPALRSPREKMAGWVHLPRFIDKIRLHQAGKLPADYQNNFASRGFDAFWLEASGLDRESFLELVRKTADDRKIEAWVKAHARRTPQEIEAFNQKVMNHGRSGDMATRLAERKAESGLSQRNDIQCFVDYIDADEGRL